MSTDSVDSSKPAARPWSQPLTWLLLLLPLLLLGAVLGYIVITGAGMRDLAGPPVEQLEPVMNFGP